MMKVAIDGLSLDRIVGKLTLLLGHSRPATSHMALEFDEADASQAQQSQ
jgi:hypothetical protein